ncbi:MAG: tetratricopeptide repeat protein [Gaiellales bacterium]
MDAELLIGLERYDEADELLRGELRRARSAGDDAGASIALEGLGVVASRRGREEEAMELMGEAVEAAGWPDPVERHDLYFELARLRSGAGDAGGAVGLLESCLERVRETHPEDVRWQARYAITLSYAHADAGEYPAAATLLAGVIREGGEDIDLSMRATVYYAMARLHNSTGQHELALEYARRALDLRHQTGEEWYEGNCHLQLANLLLTEGRTGEAATHLEQARRLYGERMSTIDDGYLKVDEALLALQLGDSASAAEIARDAIELLSSGAVPGELGQANLVLARAYEELGEDDRADATYSAAIRLFRRQNGWPYERARAYRLYGKFLRRRGRTEAALEAFEQAADLAPANQAALGPDRSARGDSSS